MIVDEMMQREEDESEDDYGEDEVVNDGLDTAALRHLCVMDASPLDESALQEAATTADGGDAMEKSLHRAASDVIKASAPTTGRKSIMVENCHWGSAPPFEPTLDWCPWNFYREPTDTTMVRAGE